MTDAAQFESRLDPTELPNIPWEEAYAQWVHVCSGLHVIDATEAARLGAEQVDWTRFSELFAGDSTEFAEEIAARFGLLEQSISEEEKFWSESLQVNPFPAQHLLAAVDAEGKVCRALDDAVVARAHATVRAARRV